METKDKYKKLELLVNQMMTRLDEKEAENEVLANKIKMLESSLRIHESTQETVKALADWKEITTVLLKRLYLKIDKEIMRIESQVATPKIDK